ncbi:hypothetical protein [Streptomyces sp. NPDC047928]|uniref:SCO2584 family spore wall biosynthesis protein n=1 Tax=unclassified Streptomyces TaxID=2593676 RepID=UPI00371CF825
MPDDVGGRPFPNGWEPDDDRGGADEDFAPVVFDEDFVRAAAFHEPTAVERLVAAAQARADADASGSRARRGASDDEYADDGYGRDHGFDDDLYSSSFGVYGPYGPHGGALRPYRPSSRWHRPVAWIVALLMGIGMVALAFAAVYRGSSGDRDKQVPAPATTPATTPTGGGPDTSVDPLGTGPSDAVGHHAPPVSALPPLP